MWPPFLKLIFCSAFVSFVVLPFSLHHLSGVHVYLCVSVCLFRSGYTHRGSLLWALFGNPELLCRLAFKLKLQPHLSTDFSIYLVHQLYWLLGINLIIQNMLFLFVCAIVLFYLPWPVHKLIRVPLRLEPNPPLSQPHRFALSTSSSFTLPEQSSTFIHRKKTSW